MNIFDIVHGNVMRKYQLGGLIDTTFGGDALNNQFQGVDPRVQALQLNTEGFNAASYINALDQATRNKLNQDKFDFEVQQEFRKVSDDFADSIYAANKNIKSGLQGGDFGLNTAYARDLAASTKGYNILESAQTDFSKLFKTGDFKNLSTVGLEGDKIRLKSQRQIENESGISQELLLNKKKDKFIDDVQKRKDQGERTNMVKYNEIIQQFEDYKNNLDPAASFNEAKLDASSVLYNEQEAQEVIDLWNKTLSESAEDVELVSTELGLPNRVYAELKTKVQRPVEARAAAFLEAIKGNRNVQNFIEGGGQTIEEFAAGQAELYTKKDTTEETFSRDLRIKSNGGNSSAGERTKAANRRNREKLLDAAQAGDPTAFAEVTNTDFTSLGVDAVKLGGKPISHVEFVEDASLFTNFPDPNAPKHALKVTTVEAIEGESALTESVTWLPFDGSKRTLAVFNDLLNSGLDAGDKVPREELPDYFKSKGGLFNKVMGQ